jgi:class 3 adenylate cyclase
VSAAQSPTLTYRRRKRWLGVHAAVFAILNAANIGQWLLLRDAPLDEIDPKALATFWPGWLLITWGVVLGIHGVYVWSRKPVVEVEDPGPFGWRRGRGVRTVVFTDIVGSTERARAMGDAGWKKLLGRHDRLAEQLARRSRGTVVKHIGDGQLVLFDAPKDAIRFATTFRAESRDLDVRIRAGIHAGEVDVERRDVTGIGVHIASRVMGEAAPSEILVSRTVRDLVAGSDVAFVDRGQHTLKGLDGDWQLFAVGTADAKGPA